MLSAGLFAYTVVGPASVSSATAVSGTSVSNLTFSPSTSAGGATEATWQIGFTTSSSGALVAGSGTVTVSAPSGTTLPSSGCYYYFSESTNGTSGNCGYATLSNDGSTATVTVPSSVDVANNDTVSLTIGTVGNPAGGTSYSGLSVSTSSDTVPASYTGAGSFTAAQAVSAVTSNPSTTAGGATEATWQVGFTTSSNGALVAGSGTVTISAPSGTTLPSNGCDYDFSESTNGTSGNCGYAALSNDGSTATVTVPSNVDVANNDTVSITIYTVGNPAAGASYSGLSVSTSTDTVPASYTGSGSFTAAQAVPSLTFSPSNSVGDAGNVTYTIGFKTSSTGNLVPGYGTVTISAPSGTTLPSNGCDYDFSESTNGTSGNCGYAALSNDGSTATVTVPSSVDVADNDTVSLTIEEVTNPPAGTPYADLSLSTSSDTVPTSLASSATFSGTGSVTALTFTPSTSAGGATGVDWALGFKTSSTGNLVPGYGTVTISAPSGTTLPSNGCYYDFSESANGTSGNCGYVTLSNDGSTATVTVPGSVSVANDDSVSLTINDVANPPAGTAYSGLSVSTSSDTAPASYTGKGDFTAAQSVANGTVNLSNPGAGSTSIYTVGFDTSSTGALVADFGTVTLAAPSGTSFPSNGNDYTIEDTPSGLSAQSCGVSDVALSNSDATVTLTLGGCFDIGAGDSVDVVATGVTNPTTTSSNYVMTITTSSDTKSAQTSPYSVNGIPGAPQDLVATPGDSQVALQWSAPQSDGGSAVTSYNVYEGTSSGNETLLASATSGTSYTATGLTNGTTYYFYVTAVNSVGEGPQSNEASATPQAPATVPTAPQDLTTTPGDTQISLSWSAPQSDGSSAVTSYNVYEGTSSGSETLLTSVTSGTSHVVSGLTNGTEYYFYVTAVNSAGQGQASNEVSVTPEGSVSLPGAPVELTATASAGQVVLSWSAPPGSSYPITYNVYEGTSPGGEQAAPVATATSTTGTTTDVLTGLANGTTYYFYIGTAGSGAELYSKEASATPFTTTVATVTEVTPGSGPTSGSTLVYIYGTNLSPGGATCSYSDYSACSGVSVSFGGQQATVLLDSPGLVAVLTPAEPAGSVDVTVDTPSGPVTAPDAYTYN